VQYGELARVRARNRLETLNPFKLSLEGTRIDEASAMDDLYRPQFAQNIPRQPHLAIGPDADPLQKLKIGNKILAGVPVVLDSLWCRTDLRSGNVAVQQWDWRMHAEESYRTSVAVTIEKSSLKTA